MENLETKFTMNSHQHAYEGDITKQTGSNVMDIKVFIVSHATWKWESPTCGRLKAIHSTMRCTADPVHQIVCFMKL